MKNKIKVVRDVTCTSDNEVSNEPHSLYLESQGFKRAPTEQAQFYDLVTDAWKYTGQEMNDFVRVYLGVMLQRFMDRTDVFSVLLSYRYLQEFLSPSVINEEGLRDIADISLLSQTIFSERSQYRHFTLSPRECIDIGVSMYGTLYQKEKKDNWWKDAYKQMYERYMLAVSVLKSLDQRDYIKSSNSNLLLPHVRILNNTSVSLPDAVSNFRHMYLKNEEESRRDN